MLLVRISNENICLSNNCFILSGSSEGMGYKVMVLGTQTDRHGTTIWTLSFVTRNKDSNLKMKIKAKCF